MVELIWNGKYDENGQRVAPLRVALPFQTVETVNESSQQRQKMLDLFSTGRDTDWRNRLIWGDKKYVLPSLLPEFAGKVDLIYIDPPFATGADFSFQAQVGEASFEKEPSILEQKAYRDTWGRGIDGYVAWVYETLVFAKELLSPTGSLYTHIDPTVSHYVKLMLDELYGVENYRNEIIWKRTSSHGNVSQKYGAVHDVIFYYTASDDFTWNPLYVPYEQEYIDTFFDQTDEDGRIYARRDLTASMSRASASQIYEWKGITPPPSRCWAMTKDKMDELERKGLIHWPKKEGGMPRLKLYPENLPGSPVQDLWTDIRIMHNLSSERANYPTQKPETLLERIINASSNEGDLVLDCFCGSGTTAAVAEKLGRRWITCDLGRFAIHTARKRLLAIEGVKPFVVQNLGKYERQVWQSAEFGANAGEVMRQYRRFILDLYHADSMDGTLWLHGKKGRRLVHVGAVDSPVTSDDVSKMAIELRKLLTGGETGGVDGIDVLGWDFALDLNETAKQVAADARINVRFVRIPREVLEKKAVDQGDIRFFELAALSLDVKVDQREVSVSLTDFMVPPDDVPEEIREQVTRWDAWIDYWAVDWDFKGDAFHNQWQTYRTRKDRSLSLTAHHPYESAGTYTVLVKVIDIFGNDTTKAIDVVVG